MLTGRDNAVIFDPSQVFKLIQISEPDRALIADAPKLLIERDALQARVKELKAHLRKIHDRAHSWRNIPACGDVEQMAAQALGLKGGA